MDSFERLLSLKKFGRHRIIKKRGAGIFKFPDLALSQLKTGLLLLIQFLTAFLNGLVGKTCLVVAKEGLHLGQKAFIIGITRNRFAKFPCF